MGWSCVIISTVNQKQHTQELLSNVLPFINTLSFDLNIRTLKRQRLVNVFVSNVVSTSTFPTQAMELQVSSSWQQDHCENISNAGYGTASFLITATGPLQKPSVWLLSCSSPMALQVRKPLKYCSWRFGNVACKAWEPV
jgi:hypothetical protein